MPMHYNAGLGRSLVGSRGSGRQSRTRRSGFPSTGGALRAVPLKMLCAPVPGSEKARRLNRRHRVVRLTLGCSLSYSDRRPTQFSMGNLFKGLTAASHRAGRGASARVGGAGRAGHCQGGSGPGAPAWVMPPHDLALIPRPRIPAAIIQHAIWLYIRFTLSYCDVEDLLAERGRDLSYERIRRWVLNSLLKRSGVLTSIAPHRRSW
jgi:hypothetical protein